VLSELVSTLTSMGFMPHGMCYLWYPPLLWLHVGADLSIGLAYVSISATLGYLVFRIRDIPFQWMYVAFGVFIIACAGTHFMEVWTVWSPHYWTGGALKAVTAVASVGTAILLPPLIPKAADFARAAQVALARGIKLETAYQVLGTVYERTKELERIKTQFFANISHELRTPLALILGPAERLEQSPNLTADERRQLAVISRNARILLKHVNDLLDVSRLEAGKLDLDYRRADLSVLVRRVASNFDVLAEEKQIQFTVDTPPSLRAELDVDHIQKVLTNLLGNAFKFTPVGGRVRCTVAGHGHDTSAAITVADSGPGVPAEMRTVIFERFRQVDDSTTRRFGGTGLGLAIVKELLTLGGGDVRVSTAPEGGAQFDVRLPLRAPAGAQVRDPDPGGSDAPRSYDEAAQQAIATISSHIDAATALAGGGRGTVLIVEDNVDMNRFVAETLAADDYDVQRAFDGAEALEKARERPPDVILTDVMMPRLSGDQLVVEARKDPALAHVPVVLLTAKADDGLRVRLLREGAQDYVMKPFSPEELRARVANQVVVKRARDVLQRELANQVSDLEQLAREMSVRKRELESTLGAMRVAREHAERASAAKSNFLGLVSHELRTPMTTLQLHLRLLQRDADALTPKQRQLVDKMAASSKRLLDMIEALLELTRLESGRVQVEPQPVDVSGLLRDVAEEFQTEAAAKGLAIDIARVDPSVDLVTDPRILRIVLSNLVSNAVKYSDEGGVSLSGLADDGRLRIVVTDTGRGIPDGDHARVFERFEQLESVSHKHLPGMGLGLALAREMAEALGGRIDLQSAPGRGSTFSVWLPMNPAPAARPEVHS
jgi:signal transduction histidine kinase